MVRKNPKKRPSTNELLLNLERNENKRIIKENNRIIEEKKKIIKKQKKIIGNLKLGNTTLEKDIRDKDNIIEELRNKIASLTDS